MKFPTRNKITTKEIKNIDFNKKYNDVEMVGQKPEGFWYSCGSDWYEYMYKYETHPSKEKKYLYKVNLKRNVFVKDLKIKDVNKILYIGNNEIFEQFSKEYGFNASYFVKKEKKKFKEYGFDASYFVNKIPIGIDWNKVKKDYGGIEICPFLEGKYYVWWYYGWDAASGVIWNIEPILKEIQLVGIF